MGGSGLARPVAGWFLQLKTTPSRDVCNNCNGVGGEDRTCTEKNSLFIQALGQSYDISNPSLL